MKNILIIGKNGYIATRLFDTLCRDTGARRAELCSSRDGQWRELDFSRFDCVFYAAGIAHIRETAQNASLYYEINRDLAWDVAQKAKREGVGQFIYMSSLSVYGLRSGHITEDTVPQPVTHYGRSKLEAEQKLFSLADDCFRVAVIRAPMVFGKDCPGKYGQLRKLALSLPFFPLYDNRRSMIFIDHLCLFIRALIDSEEGGVFIPQDAQYHSTSALVRDIAAAHGKKVPLLHSFSPLIRLLCRISDTANSAFGSLTCSQSMSRPEWAYRPYDAEESVRRTEC